MLFLGAGHAVRDLDCFAQNPTRIISAVVNSILRCVFPKRNNSRQSTANPKGFLR
jgi:hypothetical protein